jgi:hypothetical protein
MDSENDCRLTFFTLVQSEGGERCVRLLIDSLRSFGGRLAGCPIWIFHTFPLTLFGNNLKSTNVSTFPLRIPDSVEGYKLSGKVCACASAEENAMHGIRSLVWLDSEYLILNPPILFDLASSFDAAVRPVHIKNVGSPISQPVDDYWKGIYDAVGVADVDVSVESFMDMQHIRAYFNTHAFSVNPEHGLLRKWVSLFELLVCDREFQANACPDVLHRIFLHQAILSTLLVTELGSDKIRMLPPDYNYPYNLHQKLPEERQARSLNDLTGVVYEDRSMHPDVVDDIIVEEPLGTWLRDHLDTPQKPI